MSKEIIEYEIAEEYDIKPEEIRQAFIFYKMYHNDLKSLQQAENCSGARRNGKALEQMYQLVNYSKAPMKPSLWIANIDSKTEQRVVMEKEDYDIKSKKEKAFDLINEKDIDVKLLKWAYPSVEAYNVKVRTEKDYWWRKELTQEEFEFIGRMVGAE